MQILSIIIKFVQEKSSLLTNRKTRLSSRFIYFLDNQDFVFNIKFATLRNKLVHTIV
jgi:hypothetical protein